MTDYERHRAHMKDPNIPADRDSAHSHRLASEKQMNAIASICKKRGMRVPDNLLEITHHQASDFISCFLKDAAISVELRWWEGNDESIY